jgi:hypothetical protein
MHGRESACFGERESMDQMTGPTISTHKNVIIHKKKIKLNSVYTIKFVSINSSKQDVTWIYLDKVTSGLHNRQRMI